MLSSQIPVKFPIPFAKNAGAGFSNPIPTNSQIGILGGAASLNDGFPPLTFLPVGAGGIPPWGRDFNGILNQSTSWNQWQQAGGAVPWDSAFSTAIGGYPQGAFVASTVSLNLWWLSLVDNNTSNPDSGGANWYPCSFAPPVIGDSRQLVGSAPGGTKTASWTVQELIAKIKVGGAAFLGNNLSLSFNGATTGAGGMDTGSTPTSADMAIYAIVNYPGGGGWSTLGTIACNGLTYTGSNLPIGFPASQTASVLLWSGKTTGSGFIRIFTQKDRIINVGSGNLDSTLQVLQAASSAATPVAYNTLSIASAVPANARSCYGYGLYNPGSGAAGTLAVATTSTGVGAQYIGDVAAGVVLQGGMFYDLACTGQTIYWCAIFPPFTPGTGSAGGPGGFGVGPLTGNVSSIFITGYSI